MPSPDMSFGRSVYHETKNDYNQSKIKAYLDRVVAGTAGEGKPDFSKVAGAMRDTEYGKLYLLSYEEAKNIPIPGRDIKDSWWLRTPGTIPYSDCSWVMGVHNGGYIDMVGSDPSLDYGIRPALQLDLDAVNFEVEWRTFHLRRSVSVSRRLRMRMCLGVISTSSSGAIYSTACSKLIWRGGVST